MDLKDYKVFKMRTRRNSEVEHMVNGFVPAWSFGNGRVLIYLHEMSCSMVEFQASRNRNYCGEHQTKEV